MAIYYGTDTLLRGQNELSNLGLAGPELYEALEIVLIYQLLSDSAAIFNIGRSVPAVGRALLTKATWALNRLSRISPRQWLHLKLSSPKHLARPITQAELAVKLGGPSTHSPRQLEFGFVDAVESQTTAYQFYGKTTDWTGKRILAHLGGIDFGRGVKVVTLPKNTLLVQHTYPGQVGNYFTYPGTPAKGLGIFPHGRQAQDYVVTSDTIALRSVASDTVDTWSVPGWAIDVPGGEMQFFVPNTTVVAPNP
jgi:hypothetical protein